MTVSLEETLLCVNPSAATLALERSRLYLTGCTEGDGGGELEQTQIKKATFIYLHTITSTAHSFLTNCRSKLKGRNMAQ